MPRDTNKQPQVQEVIVQPLAINYDRFKDDEIPDVIVRNKLNSAWRALDGLSAIGRIIEANHVEQTSQEEPLRLHDRGVTGLLSAIVALAEIGREAVDDCGERLHRKVRSSTVTNNGGPHDVP